MIWRARRGVHVVGAQTSPGGGRSGGGGGKVVVYTRINAYGKPRIDDDDFDDGKKNGVASGV